MIDNELLLFDRMEMIKTTIAKYGEEKFYISFSGGKDSTVLHHLIDEAIPNNNIPRVFINTGIEYEFIRKYVIDLKQNDDRFVIFNSNVNITKMLHDKGYPFKSKEHPIQRYEKKTGRNISILGLRMGEGGQRANHEGCVVFNNNHELKKFKPLNPCSNEFIEWYLHKRNIELCSLYYPPYNFKRTGCKGCPYAIDLQDQLEIMEKYFPNERKQCELIWKPIYQEYRRISYRLKRIEEKRLF